MTLDEKVRKTLAELGVSDASGVEALFAEVRAAMESERQALVSHGAASETERQHLAKELRDRWLARKNGIFSFIDENWLKKADKEIKPAVGRKFNELRKKEAEFAVEQLVQAIPIGISKKVEDYAGQHWKDAVTFDFKPDLALPGYRRSLGSIHPVTQVMREIEDIFLGLGFSIETGPEIETTYYNFDALNIPETHPARDDWDTLYIDPPKSGRLLRRFSGTAFSEPWPGPV